MESNRPPDGGEAGRAVSPAWRRLALAAVMFTFLLVVLGGIVRITGSGMGCGDDWPLCNGYLIPTFDLETFLEWSHRLVAGVVSILVVALAAVAWKPGRPPEWRGRRRISVLALVLLTVQVLLGAVTVWLELPPGSVILHLGTAMLLLAVLLVGTLQGFAGEERAAVRADEASRGTLLFAAGAFVVVLAGALVANLDAAGACRGFPLCGGRWWPVGSVPAQIQWGHRLLAYGLTAAALFLPGYVGSRRPRDRKARTLAFVTVGLILSQIAVGAALVTGPLTLGVRALHLALGTGMFGFTVALAWLVRRPAAGTAPVGAPGGAAGRALSTEN